GFGEGFFDVSGIRKHGIGFVAVYAGEGGGGGTREKRGGSGAAGDRERAFVDDVGGGMVTMKRTPEFDKLYPFRGHFLTVEQEQLHYLDEGSGDPVLMLHGNPTWSFYYRNLVRDLRGRFRCVVPDHIGCGFSSKPQHYPYTLARHILNVERLVEDLDLRKITLVVHDWGGAIGMGFAVRNPERISRIVVLNTAAFLSRRIPWRINICRVPGLGALIIRGFNGFAGPAVFMATKKPGGLPREVARGFLLPYRSWGNRVANLRFVQDIPMSPRHPT